ncbi:MAG: glycosyltransferase family 4 protein [Chloroflexi bacterium]|nr:glycosyltransferase family 4 protein [Chloroflexota bacterium]
MRIAIDYTAAVNQHAGIGRYVRGLVDALAAFDTSNEYVLFYAYQRQTKPRIAALSKPNFRQRAIPVSDRILTILSQRLAVPLPMDLLTGPVDVFHSPDFVLPHVRRAVTVLTVHDLSFLLFPECADSGLRSYLEKAVPRSVARADLITADSLNTKNDLVCLLDAEPERVEVVFGGVDEKFRPLRDDWRLLAAVRRKYRIDFPFILSIGVIEPRKNLGRLIRAYALLKARGGFAHKLLIVGRKGWLYEGVFHTVAELGLDKDVIFLGYVSDSDLPVLYNLADVFAFPSLYEGFGFPVLEAMACGTPVVSSNRSSLPEVVGEAGLLASPDDVGAIAAALDQMLNDSHLRDDLVQRGLQRARQFTWQRAAERIVEVYSRAARER